MHVQTKRVIRMKINAATTCSVCFEEKGRGEVGKGGVGPEPFIHHACHMIRAKQKPINQLSSIQIVKATYSDFIPYATAT